MQMELLLLVIVIIAGGILYIRHVLLSSKVDELTIEIELLRKKLNSIMSAAQKEVTKEFNKAAEITAPLPPLPLIVPPKAEEPIVKPCEITPSIPVSQAQPIFTPLPPPQRVRFEEPTRTKEEWEALVGGKLLNRVGALALIFGIGFFLKYAFDNNWISETVRVLMGIGAGIGLLFSAVRSNKKGFQIFAQGLVGAGIAILYLSIYASFNYYHLVSQMVAFGLMSVITAVTFLQALKYDSRVVSLLGLIGGFLTPIMLSTDQVNEVGLFTYIALLDVGILAVVLMKEDWIILEPLSLFATFFFYFAWYVDNYCDISTATTQSNFIPTVFFLNVFWLIYYGTDFWRQYQKKILSGELHGFLSAALALWFYVNLYAVMELSHHSIMGLTTILLGGVYLGSALVLRRKNGEQFSSFAQNVVMAIIFLVIATAVEYKGLTIAGLWSLEALALLLCARRWKMRYVWKTALIIYGLALVQLLIPSDSLKIDNYENFLPLLNRRMFIYVVFIISSIGGAIVFHDADKRVTITVKSAFHNLWGAILLLLCIIETNDYFGRMRYLNVLLPIDVELFQEALAIAAVTMVYGVGIFFIGLKRKLEPVMQTALIGTGISLLVTLIGGSHYVPIEHFTLLFNIRMAITLFVLGGILVHILLIKKNMNEFPWLHHILQGLQIIVVVIIFFILTTEVIDVFMRKLFFASTSSERTQIDNIMQMSLSIVWLLYSIALMGIGIWKQFRGLRILSIILFGFTILKIFIYDLSFLQTLYRIFSFIGLGLILLFVSYLYQRYKELIFGKPNE